MKKIVISLFLFIIFLFLPAFARAAMFSVPNPLPSFNSIQDVVKVILDAVFGIAGLVAVIYLIIGGFRYITSSGNQEQIEAAKMTIMNAVIGLIVIFISVLLVNYILVALKVGPLYQLNTSSSGGIFQGPSNNSKPDNFELPVPNNNTAPNNENPAPNANPPNVV